MKRYLFLFGRTPALSLLELQSLCKEVSLVHPAVALVEADIDAGNMLQMLGGTVKIAEVIGEEKKIDPEQIASLFGTLTDSHRITFGISAYGGAVLPRTITTEVKDFLTRKGYSARYVETKDEASLSSVVIAKQHVLEIVVVKHAESYVFAVTRAIQDFEDWNKRDFGRPASDPKSGMLPPKVSRMIVNIALSDRSPTYTPTLMDPFCGVGTVIGEGLMRGANVIGADISETAVAHTKKNMEWLRREYPSIQSLYANVVVGDATHISEHVAPGSVDAIATEPFMGETIDAKKAASLTPERIKNTLKGLEKLYIGSLREWSTVLKKGGRIVMAMPAVVSGRNITRVKNVVDRCESLGYTLLTGPIEYSRPQAVVRREFYIFQKTK